MGTRAEALLKEYSESHQNRTNQILHKVCVPMITLSLVGALWALPKPSAFDSNWLNFGTIAIFLALIYYATLGVKYFAKMVLMSAVVIGLVALVPATVLMPASIAVFVVGWIGQFYGHKVEGKKPSFFKDLQFLLIGPLWVFRR